MKKGNLLIPKTDEGRSTWGRGIVTEPYKLSWPDTHLVYWFGHKREVSIEQEVLEKHFEVVEAQTEEGE